MFKKIIYFMLGFSILTTVGSLLFYGYIGKLVSNPDKMNKIIGKLGGDEIPVGAQLPQWLSGAFSPDGKYYAYTYSITDVKTYNSRYGSNTSVTYWLQVIAAKTATPLLDKAVQIQGSPVIMSIENNHVWLAVYDIKEDKSSPALYLIGEKSLKFTPKDLDRINPGLPAFGNKGVISFFQSGGGAGNIIIEASDARQYLIDGTNGKFMRTPLVSTLLSPKGQRNLQVVESTGSYTKKGGSRNNIFRKDTNVSSSEDFIEPNILIQSQKSLVAPNQLLTYTNHIFVLSSTSTIGHQDKQLSLMDSTSLKTIWTIDLPQETQDINTYDCERFAIQAQTMYAANKTHYFLIDLQKGSIIKFTSLYPSK